LIALKNREVDILVGTQLKDLILITFSRIMNADNMLYHPILGLLKEVFKNDTGGAFRTFRKQGRVIIQK
jgi:primosomal protein N'